MFCQWLWGNCEEFGEEKKRKAAKSIVGKSSNFQCFQKTFQEDKAAVEEKENGLLHKHLTSTLLKLHRLCLKFGSML